MVAAGFSLRLLAQLENCGYPGSFAQVKTCGYLSSIFGRNNDRESGGSQRYPLIFLSQLLLTENPLFNLLQFFNGDLTCLFYIHSFLYQILAQVHNYLRLSQKICCGILILSLTL